MGKLIKWFFILVVLGGGGFGFYKAGFDLEDLKNNFLAASLLNQFSREVVWQGLDFSLDKRFRAEAPLGFEVKTQTDSVSFNNQETGEEIKVSVKQNSDDEIATDLLKEVEVDKVKISGEEATVIKDKNLGGVKVYVPISEKEVVVVEGGETALETAKRIDLTPNELNWALLGEEVAETERIAKQMDYFVAKLAPDKAEEGLDWETEAIVKIEGEPLAYIGYQDGVNERVMLIQTTTGKEEPTIVGYFRYGLKKTGGKWVVQDKNGSILAELPSKTSGFVKKTTGNWTKE